MLDAVQYIKLACDVISDATTKNVFKKLRLLKLEDETDKEVDLMADLLCSFKMLNIPIDEGSIVESLQ